MNTLPILRAKALVAVALLLALSVACSSASATPTHEPTPTADPTATPQPTDTPRPTNTPAPTATPTPLIPHVINHPRPTLTLDFAPFTDIGCPLDDGFSGWCQDDSPLVALGCYGIEKPPNLLGALEPSYPIVRCYVGCNGEGERTQLPSYAYRAEGSCFYTIGGKAAFPVSYLLFRDDQFNLIKTEEQFREIFAPIETADEALSYVVAVTGLFALYGIEPNPGFEYFVEEIEDTNVETIEDGYLVHLFHYAAFGCGPHLTSAVDFHVTPQGKVHQLGMTPVFKDPEMDSWCVD